MEDGDVWKTITIDTVFARIWDKGSFTEYQLENYEKAKLVFVLDE